MLRDFAWTGKYEEEMSDEHPHGDKQNNLTKDPVVEGNDGETPNGSSDDLPDNVDNEGTVLEVKEETSVKDFQST